MTRILTRLVSAGALLAAMAAIVVGSANAAVFSPFIPPTLLRFDDCAVLAGPVKDPNPSSTTSTYRKYGGVQINCSSRHAFIEATVGLFYWTGSSWRQVGRSGYAYFPNTAGWGGSYITVTPDPVCGHGYYWTTGVTIRDERGSATLFSESKPDLGSGC
jgi:hypothetical protein